jgi:hypothetical protein
VPIIGDSGILGVPERGYRCGCGENGDAVLRLAESNAMGIPREKHDLGRLDVDRLRYGVEIYPVCTRDETVHRVE